VTVAVRGDGAQPPFEVDLVQRALKAGQCLPVRPYPGTEMDTVPCLKETVSTVDSSTNDAPK